MMASEHLEGILVGMRSRGFDLTVRFMFLQKIQDCLLPVPHEDTEGLSTEQKHPHQQLKWQHCDPELHDLHAVGKYMSTV